MPTCRNLPPAWPTTPRTMRRREPISRRPSVPTATPVAPRMLRTRRWRLPRCTAACSATRPPPTAGWPAPRRLLEPLGDVVEQGYLELAIMACDRPDVAGPGASAERALGIPRRFGDADLEVRALADGGLAMVCQGRLREGFAWLDEALAGLTARRLPSSGYGGEESVLVAESCDRSGDLRRADEWSRLVEDLLRAEGGGPTVLAEHCRMVQSGILTAAGRWEEAEESLTAVLAAMASSAPHRVETMARLAELHLHRGQLEEAASLVAPHQDAVTMKAPLARLHLIRGGRGRRSRGRRTRSSRSGRRSVASCAAARGGGAGRVAPR